MGSAVWTRGVSKHFPGKAFIFPLISPWLGSLELRLCFRKNLEKGDGKPEIAQQTETELPQQPKQK